MFIRKMPPLTRSRAAAMARDSARPYPVLLPAPTVPTTTTALTAPTVPTAPTTPTASPLKRTRAPTVTSTAEVSVLYIPPHI